MKYNVQILIIGLIISSCNKDIVNEVKQDTDLDMFPYKLYELDQDGNIIFSEIDITDFEPSQYCVGCHNDHYNEWKLSSHHISINSPLFSIQKQKTENEYGEIGGRFCIQCHNPSLLVSNMINDDVNEVINDGIGCDFCHTITRLNRKGIDVNDQLLVDVEYFLNSGENIKYGSIINPEEQNFHISEYNPIYNDSKFCLPCHNMKIRDINAHITFEEWESNTENDMADNRNCQSCHMPSINDDQGGHHSHMFSGLDIDITKSINHPDNQLRIESIESLLDSAVISYFYNSYDTIVSDIISGDTLHIPITLRNLTAHNIPTGTSYNREAWNELIVTDNNDNIICEFGTIENNYDVLDYNTENIIFTSWVFDTNGDTIYSSIDIHNIENNTLNIDEFYEWNYICILPQNLVDKIFISSKMRIRSIKPQLFYSNSNFDLNLLENIPVFDINSTIINSEINIIE